MSPVRVVGIGECMIEMRARYGATATMTFGGDSANFAIYLSHYGVPRGIDVSYVTAVGEDSYSRRLTAWLDRHDVSTRFVRVVRGGKVGLYLIDNTATGERTFTYYRDGSAARQLFSGAAGRRDLAAIDYADWVYLSGISVAILAADARDVLLLALDGLRERGGQVVFDTNFRPALWPDLDSSRRITTEFLRRTDLALPTALDDRQLFGDVDEHATADRLHQLGVPEVVVKLGDRGCLVSAQGERTHVPIAGSGQALDTTAAGDSFNAGYVFGRIQGETPCVAARLGAHVAAAVVSHQGAVIDPRHLPDIRSEEVNQ